MKHTGYTGRKRGSMEQMVGNMLRIGVVAAAIVSAAGGALYVGRHAREPRGDYSHFSSASATSFAAVQQGFINSDSILHVGILLLIATPILRIILSAVAFAIKKDLLYVVFTLVVLGIIFLSMMERWG